MPLRSAAHEENVAQLCLCAGIASFVLAMTLRRVREEYRARHKVSSRSKELTRGGTPEHILEHIKRLTDEDYVCLAIAENKLTVRDIFCALIYYISCSAKLTAVLQYDNTRSAIIVV